MPTRDIVCMHCGHAGILDIHCEKDVVPKDRIFEHLGHNPCSGDLHYRCPACKIVLLVDPLAALGELFFSGLPGKGADVSSGMRRGPGSGRRSLLRWFNRLGTDRVSKEIFPWRT